MALKKEAWVNFTKKLTILSQLYPYLLPKNKHLQIRFSICVVLFLVSIGLNLYVPLVFKQVINTISNPTSALSLAKVLLIFYGFIWMLGKTSDQFRIAIMYRIIEKAISTLSLNIFDHLIHLSLRFHSDKKTGAITSAINRAQHSLPSIIWGLFFVVIPTVIEITLATLILIYLYDSIFGIVLALILTTYMIFSIIASSWTTKSLRIANEKINESASRLVDSLLNYETIRHFCNQKFEYNQCDYLLSQREIALARQQIHSEYMLIGQGIIMGIGLIILTWLSGIKVMEGVLHVSDFVLINGYLLQFMLPLGQFGFSLRHINDSLTNFEDIIDVLNEKPEIRDLSSAKPLKVREASIIFNKVTFGYDSRRLILNEVSFEIPAKKTVAIVGPTGSGKSTIAKLLFRHYDAFSGEIIFDGQNIQEVTQLSLQAAIGVVPQHNALFNDTLRYNIVYGRPDASEMDIKSAIKNAHLDLLVDSLPDGLNTIVGENGLKLSGGERQRIGIARVLLKNPSFYLFDEATSSLDTRTEHSIQKNIEEVSRNITTLIIAHRLSTIVHADRIIVLEHGRIVEQGTHEELLSREGLYSLLWAKQALIEVKNKINPERDC